MNVDVILQEYILCASVFYVYILQHVDNIVEDMVAAHQCVRPTSNGFTFESETAVSHVLIEGHGGCDGANGPSLAVGSKNKATGKLKLLSDMYPLLNALQSRYDLEFDCMINRNFHDLAHIRIEDTTGNHEELWLKPTGNQELVLLNTPTTVSGFELHSGMKIEILMDNRLHVLDTGEQIRFDIHHDGNCTYHCRFFPTAFAG